MAVLPDGYTVRRPALSDAEAVFELLSAYNTAVVGFADLTPADVAADLADPGIDLETDAWLVYGTGSVPVGYAVTLGKGRRDFTTVDVWSADSPVAGWLLDHAMERAREMGRHYDQAEVIVDICIYQDDEPMRALLTDQGFVAETTYHRMRIDHAGPVAAPEPPTGVVVRRGVYDAAGQWAAHEVLIQAFTGQRDFTPRPHDEWVALRSIRASSGWDQMTLLELDGRAVAIRDCTEEYVADENCGYIGTLAVLEEARGRGLAKFLLREAFALDAAAGRVGTILHVDTTNPTKALAVYESVGMRVTLVMEGWRRVLRAG